jgi:hypothetical protein
MLYTRGIRSRFTRQAAIGRPSRSTMVRAASSAIGASRCKSAPVTRRLRLLAPRPDMLAARLLAPLPDMLAARPLAPLPDMLAARPLAPLPDMLAARPLAIRSPPACSASGHTIRNPGPIWVMMANAIPVREPLGISQYLFVAHLQSRGRRPRRPVTESITFDTAKFGSPRSRSDSFRAAAERKGCRGWSERVARAVRLP